MKFSSALLAGFLLAGASPALAHFNLMYPPSATTQNATGDPQKTPPCGGSAKTNVVTKVRAGDVITLKWSETVPHDGHFRISITDGAPSVFKDPVVTGANCGAAAIEASPTMPTLMDGIHVHKGTATKMWEQQITIPNMSCAKCTLQVLQFMANHGTPCFYYHCAELEITAAGGPTDGGAGDAGGGADAAGAGGSPGSGGSSGAGGSGGTPGTGGSTSGTGGSAGAGSGGTSGGASGGSSGAAKGGSTGSPSSSDSGGGCAVGGVASERGPGGWALLALALGLVFRSRRRR
jgi:MYXO-CTERM domain-containing protein